MLIIGEKLNGAIKSVAEAIRNRDGAFIRDLASRQLDSRADYLDICSGVPEGDADVLGWMIDLIQTDHPDVRFSLDSPSPDTILACIPLCKNPGFINSVSLEGDKIAKILPAVSGEEGWKIIALLLDESGMPETVEKRMESFHRIVEKAAEIGVSMDRLYFDPLVFTVATSPDSFLNFIGAMMNGMDSAIMDPTNRDMLGGVYAAEALLGIDEYCIEYLSAYRDDLFGVQISGHERPVLPSSWGAPELSGDISQGAH